MLSSRANMAGRAGVVDLRDLGSRYAWDELKIAGLIRAAGLEPQGPVKQRFGPPEVVVAVVAFEDMEQVERSRAWLQDAQRVLVLRRHDEEPIADAELRDYVEELWQELATGFAVPLELHDWRTQADLRGTLKHAAELAEQLDRGPPSRFHPARASSGCRGNMAIRSTSLRRWPAACASRRPAPCSIRKPPHFSWPRKPKPSSRIASASSIARYPTGGASSGSAAKRGAPAGC
jgi:hypothetical protein